MARCSAIELPPSTIRYCPVMYDAPGLASQAMAAAISSGEPLRPAGVACPWPRSSGVWEPVAIQPGATALTVIPCLAVSTAAAR